MVSEGKIQMMRRGTHLLLGFITTISGFAVMWASAVGGTKVKNDINNLLDQAVEIDVSKPSADNNGRLVVAAGALTSTEQLEDEYVKPGPFLILRRTVEMYQWKEELPTIENPQGDPVYLLDWINGQVDFFQFRQPKGHENPLMKIHDQTLKVRTSRFGAFDGNKLIESITTLAPLMIKESILKDPGLIIENNKVIVPRGLPGLGPVVGDLRVRYEAIQQGDFTIFTQQMNEENLIGAGRVSTLIIEPGLQSVDDIQEKFLVQSGGKVLNLLILGGVIFCAGLTSVIYRIAPNLNLRPKIELEGMSAALIVSAAISAVMGGIFYVMSMFG